jgi:hypothetical protein
MIWGTEEGSTDLVVTHDGIRVTNIAPMMLVEVVQTALRAYRRPLPRLVGTIRGNPALEADLIPTATASLPENVEIAEQPLEPPGDARKVT